MNKLFYLLAYFKHDVNQQSNTYQKRHKHQNDYFLFQAVCSVEFMNKLFYLLAYFKHDEYLLIAENMSFASTTTLKF